MNTLEHICQKFKIHLQPDIGHRRNYQSMPLEIALNREGLARLFCELGFRGGAEIGVEQGEYSEVLASANPDCTIYLIDAWTAYKGYRDHVSQEKLDGFYEKVQGRMERYGERVEIMRGFSVPVAHHFPNDSLDFVYIDANHCFEQVVADLAAWAPKVKKGGIVSGHDYFSSDGPYHVPHALRGYTEAYRIQPWFIARGDHTASWFWVKQ